jgi:hypothetical protein
LLIIQANIYFEVVSSLGKKIRVTKSYWDFIVTSKHKTMAGKEELVKEALINPYGIQRSRKDKSVFIYYKRLEKHFIAVVCKHLNGEGHIITTYITDRIKIGDKV